MDDLYVFDKSELLTQCNSYTVGGTFTAQRTIHMQMKCYDFDTFDGDEHKRYEENQTQLTVQVICKKIETDAAVADQSWNYECPETVRTDDVFWQKFHFVVEGTRHRKVATHQSLGTPRCVRAHLSDGSNTGKVHWSTD